MRSKSLPKHVTYITLITGPSMPVPVMTSVLNYYDNIDTFGCLCGKISIFTILEHYFVQESPFLLVPKEKEAIYAHAHN